MTKKILIIAVTAVILVAVLAVFAVLAPGSRNNDNEPSDSTTPAPSADGDNTAGSSGTQDPGVDIPDTLNFGNRDITFFIWSDHTMTEFYADDVTGNTISDEIHERNALVEELLGVRLNYISEPGNTDHMSDFIKKAETDLSSGACEYDIIAGYSRTAPAMALSGNLAELTSMDYLNFDKPWWPSTLIDECTVNNKLYFCSGDISTNLLWMMVATFFNKDLINQYGLENPYDLVKNNQWTLDKMLEMCAGRYSDTDGAGTKDRGDTFGYVLYNINADAFINAAGFTALKKDNTGHIIISPDMTDQRLYSLIDKVGEFINGPDVFYENSTKVRDIFFEERSLFTTDRCFIVAGKDNGASDAKIEFEYGIIPNPKYSTDQQNFCTNVGHPYTMYAISVGVKGDNVDACAATIEMLAYQSYKMVTPAVFESAMKVKYASDDTASVMYDILRSTVVFDLGRLYSNQIGDVYATIRAQMFNNSKTFASQYKVTEKLMSAGIKTISAAFED